MEWVDCGLQMYSLKMVVIGTKNEIDGTTTFLVKYISHCGGNYRTF